MLVVLTKKITYHAGMDKRTIVGYDTTSSIYINNSLYYKFILFYKFILLSCSKNEIIKKT